MRILYVDIDTLRADHLGCYGYHRDTSPTIDAIAAEGVRFDRVYASDTPCLPSRSALISGRFGIRNGAVNHGGARAEPFTDGPVRGFWSTLGLTSWARALRNAGITRTVTISSFAERHSAWHWYAGFTEAHNPGFGGMELAEQVVDPALRWIERHGATDGWFLHVHLWDPHTPYRAPADYGEPFADDPLPAWLTEDVRAAHWDRPGPHSAQEALGFGPHPWAARFPRQPDRIASMDDVRRMFDGYDTGIRYADDHVARIVDALVDAGVWDETAVIVSSDHGETLGELAIYCDHHTADEHTSHLPMIVRWPGAPGGRVDRGLRYHLDVAATVVELAGGRVPDGWDGRSFAASFADGVDDGGREHLVVSNNSWTCQRSVRFDDWLCVRTYHDGFHGFEPVMLFDIEADPHETTDVATKHPEVVDRAVRLLEGWVAEAMADHPTGTDPLWEVVREGGPWHVRGRLVEYSERLRETGRGHWADRLLAAHPREAAGLIPRGGF